LRGFWSVALLFAVSFLAYFPSLRGGFVWDDDAFLTDNKLIHAPDGLYRFWCTTQAPDYWPVASSTLWLEWRLWGMNPTGYHVTNVVLHAMSAALLWIILRRLRVPGAFLAALVFALHPVNVQSVAWITQRKNTLALLFFLLAGFGYLKAEVLAIEKPFLPARGGRWYGVSIAAFVLGLLSKGSVAMLPVVLLGLTWGRRRLSPWDFVRTAPFFLIAAGLTAVNVWFQAHASEGIVRTASVMERLLGAGAVVWFYLSKALWPVDLSFIYPQWQIQAGQLRWWLPLIAAAALTGLLWWQRRGWGRPALLAWGFFVVSLVPVMGFTDVRFMVYSLVADHYQYVAIIGLITLAAAGWGWWYEQAAGLNRTVAAGLAVVVVGILGCLTWRQSGMYRDLPTLYRTTLERNPGCWLAHHNLGALLAQQGKLPEAIGHYEAALQLKPDFAEAENNLGNALARLGRGPEAVAHYKRALHLAPDDATTLDNLGTLLTHLGKSQEAILCFEQALRLEPDNAKAHNNLARVLDQAGRGPEAIAHYEAAVHLRPDDVEAHNNLGALLAQSGRLAEAVKHFEAALRFKPDYAEAHKNLGLALAQSGRLQDALVHEEVAVRIEPDFTEAYCCLGNILTELGRLPEAIDAFETALRLKPDYAEAHNSLGIILGRAGRQPEAVAHFDAALRFKPDYAEAHNNLGIVLAQSGQLREAIVQFEAALRLNPDFAAARQALELTRQMIRQQLNAAGK
jgi:tetratricopeptide (TPR) repeat protein